MSNSNLVNYRHFLNGKWSSRQGNRIDRIVIHHTAGVMSVEQLYSVFAVPSRMASATYGIGSDGRIGQYVDEAYRPWTTSSWEIDKRAVTIEVSNSQAGGSWPVSDAAMASLIRLVADICNRNGIQNCTFTGDKRGVLQMHKWYYATACPGPYLSARFPYIAAEVNKILHGQPKPQPKPRIKLPVYKNKNGVYRLYNPVGGDHLLTLDHKEAEDLANIGWKSEGIAYEQAGSTKIYRLYSGHEHLYVPGTDEYAGLTLLGWKGEIVAFTASLTPAAGLSPVYRLYDRNGGHHVYTASEKECDDLVKTGWKNEGIVFYERRAG